jgi:hypothetical protein
VEHLQQEQQDQLSTWLLVEAVLAVHILAVAQVLVDIEQELYQ